MVRKFSKKALTNVFIPLARDYLPGLVSNLTLNAINKSERKISGTEAVRTGKRFTSIYFEWRYENIIKTINSLEDLGVLIDGIIETLNNEIKQEDRFLPALRAPLAASLVQPIISSVVEGISWINRRGDGRAGVPPHPLNNIEITIYFTCEPRFNRKAIYNLPRIKDGAYVTNLDDKKSKGKEDIWCYYLLTEIQLHTLILLELNTFL